MLMRRNVTPVSVKVFPPNSTSLKPLKFFASSPSISCQFYVLHLLPSPCFEDFAQSIQPCQTLQATISVLRCPASDDESHAFISNNEIVISGGPRRHRERTMTDDMAEHNTIKN